MSESKPKITIRLDRESWKPDILAIAYDEEGEVIASHVCSMMYFVPHDMGITSDWKHAAYDQRYPDGYELVYTTTSEERGHRGE